MTKSWSITGDKILTKDEVRNLYKALSDAKDLALHRSNHLVYVRDYFILRLLLETGVRVSELINLKVDSFRGRTLTILNGKGGKDRSILLPRNTQSLIKEYLKLKESVLSEGYSSTDHLVLSERKKPYTQRGIRKRVKFWFTKMNFNKNLSVHSCRHSYISHLIEAGVDIGTVRLNAGHSSLNTTSLYTHLAKSDLDDFELYKTE